MQLLSGCAKHLSEKASLYFAKTGERRRLKGTEYVRKVRALRSEGHFAEYEQFRNFQNFQPPGDAAALEDDVLGELEAITRQSDTAMAHIKEQVERREDEEVEELAEFIEDSDRRKMAKLVRRLQTGRASAASVTKAIDVAYRQNSTSIFGKTGATGAETTTAAGNPSPNWRREPGMLKLYVIRC